MDDLALSPHSAEAAPLADLKKTELGLLPEVWDVVSLRDIATRLKAGGTPKRGIPEYWGGQIPFVKIEDITCSRGQITQAEEYITEEGLHNSSAWVVPGNSVLLTMYASIGETAINRSSYMQSQKITVSPLGITTVRGGLRRTSSHM